ncbi:MAG: hypothetical protein J07HR59_01532 [Halorubrum sp. J07HR59]|jgi:hypothetical protein|nr:MAG: hypothetical protein J07HR59_01532 [Halorubrum sp. J07HR59]
MVKTAGLSTSVREIIIHQNTVFFPLPSALLHMEDDAQANEGDMMTDGSGGSAGSDDFAGELAYARELLDADDIRAVHVGVVRGEEVDTTFAQRGETQQEQGLQALSLLAAHVRLVAAEAGVEPSTVAADAASLASEVDEIPAELDDS